MENVLGFINYYISLLLFARDAIVYIIENLVIDEVCRDSIWRSSLYSFVIIIIYIPLRTAKR